MCRFSMFCQFMKTSPAMDLIHKLHNNADGDSDSSHWRQCLSGCCREGPGASNHTTGAPMLWEGEPKAAHTAASSSLIRGCRGSLAASLIPNRLGVATSPWKHRPHLQSRSTLCFCPVSMQLSNLIVNIFFTTSWCAQRARS